MMDLGCPAGNPTACKSAQNRLNSLRSTYDRECGNAPSSGQAGDCQARFYFDKMGEQYVIDGKGFYVWKIYDAISNELTFCIEPGVMLNECDPYTDDYEYDVSHAQKK